MYGNRRGRIPRNYNGSGRTNRDLKEVLDNVLSRLGKLRHARPELVVAAWPSVVGPRHAKMTQAESFSDGTLTVRVTNSTLYSLLVQRERGRLLDTLKGMFPNAGIKRIYFRMG